MRAKVINKIQFGTELTKGLGTGSNPSRGRDAAMEDKNSLIEPLRDADMIFITAGMGGGTGYRCISGYCQIHQRGESGGSGGRSRYYAIRI